MIATASGDDLAAVKAFGADEVIDYKTTAFQDVVRDVDAVVDTVGGQTLDNSFNIVKKGGFVVSLVQPPAPDKAAAAGVQAMMVFTQPDGQKLRGLSELVVGPESCTPVSAQPSPWRMRVWRMRARPARARL